MADVQAVESNHLPRETKEFPRLEEVKQLVSCLNCHKDPHTKLLNCYHSLCNTCLLHFQQNSCIQCPVCLDTTPVPEKGVSMLADNSLGEDLYQITRCEIDFQKNKVVCTTCVTTPSNAAEYFCQHCKKYYCQVDFQTHQVQFPSEDKQHKIIMRGDSLSVSYCETTLDTLREGIGDMQSRANDMNQFIQEVEFHKSNVEREEQGLQCEIRDKYQELREMINNREKYLLDILNSHYDQIRKDLAKASEDVEMKLLKLYHNINFVTKTVDLSSTDILARISSKLKDQIKLTLDSISFDTEEMAMPEYEPLVFKVDNDVMNELVNFGTVGINRNYFTIDKPTMLFAKKGKHVTGGLAIDEENSVFVVDQENKRVDVFSTEGGYIRSFGQAGKKDGEFQKPYAICCRSNRILVTDLVKCNVQVFSLSGKFLSKFGSKDTLKCPIGLDMWKDGYVFVVDQTKCWVVAHTPEFNFGWLLGEGKMSRPVDLKVAQWAEIFFVLDAGAKSVVVFNRDGEVIRKFETETIQLKDPFCLALDSIGHVLVSDLQESELRVFNWAGRRCEAVCPSFGIPKGIAVDRKGRVVMAEDHEDKLQVLIF